MIWPKRSALCLVLAIVLMTAIISRANASPAQLTAEASSTLIDGAQIGEMALSRPPRKITCKIANFTATAMAGSTTITTIPTYEGCKSVSIFIGPAEVRMNGCDYLFHLQSELSEGTHVYTASADLTCPVGQGVEIDFYLTHNEYTEGKNMCQFKFWPQSGLTTIKLTNEAGGEEGSKDWIRADVEIKNITSQRTKGSAVVCGPENSTVGTLTGEAKLSGTSEFGSANGITLSTG
jgi:hypothetical protein